MMSTGELSLAVVGHVEWVTFVLVDKMPMQGVISHGKRIKEHAAGGGAVAAVQMSKLTKHKVHFFTSLGKDEIGEKCAQELRSFGIEMHIAWRDTPTRRGISLVGKNGDRAITVIGERLEPCIKDSLKWDLLKSMDGVFITAGNAKTIQYCRKAKIVCATPRVKIISLNQANIRLDALIGSNLDPDEKNNIKALTAKPRFTIMTEGSRGGIIEPGGRYKAIVLTKKEIDSYGCGDSFAAGVTTGLAANWDITKAINLGANCGAECATRFGPYNKKKI